MTPAVIAALVGLALVDSTSIGTLVLPLLMLSRPRVRASRVLAYLAAIALLYWVLGLALLLGADALSSINTEALNSRTAYWVQLIIGVAMLIGSFWPDLPHVKRAKARRDSSGEPSRVRRWSDKVIGPDATLGAVIAVAVTAGVLEAASMLPYLGAIGLITSSGVSLPVAIGTLAEYVLVMCLPALALLGARLAAKDWLAPRLERLSTWLAKRTGGAIWWVIAILGFLLARDAARELELFAR